MRAFLDTSVLIDYLEKDGPSATASSLIWDAARKHLLEVFVTTQSILDMFYIASDTQKDREAIYEFIHWMVHHIHVDSIGSQDIIHAMGCPHADLEENAQLSYAEMRGCDVIVTNDKKILNRTDLRPMRAMTPEQFAEKMKIL